MPHAAYLPSVAVLSFLRRTLRTPLISSQTSACTPRITLQSLHYPPTVLRRFPQCRALHLYQLARSSTVLGQHKILPFKRYDVPPPHVSDHKINIWTKPGGEQIAEGLSLKTVLKHYVKPGYMLYLTQRMKKSHSENVNYLRDNNVQNEFNNYSVVPASEKKVSIATHKKSNDPNHRIRDLAGLKEIHINLASPVSYWQLVLPRAYAFLDAGHKVEFSLRLRGTFLSKESRQQPGDPESWPWMHNNFPHLRPDFILKSMPEGAYYMIDPFSDGKHVQFVVAMPHKSKISASSRPSFTKHVLKMKYMVQQSIANGTQNELPKVVRQSLITTGNDMYSLDSSSARHNEPKEYLHRSKVRWGEESLDLIPRHVQRARRKEEMILKKQVKAQERAAKYQRYHGGQKMMWAPSVSPGQPEYVLGMSRGNDTWQSQDIKQVDGNSTCSSASSRREDGMGTSEQPDVPSNDRFMMSTGKNKKRLEARSEYVTMRLGRQDAEGHGNWVIDGNWAIEGTRVRQSRDTVKVD